MLERSDRRVGEIGRRPKEVGDRIEELDPCDLSSSISGS